jgi:hypothetical protein
MIFGTGNMVKKVTKGEASIGTVIIAIIICLAIAFGIDCLIVWAIMGLWNGALVAAVPFISSIGYWQAWGIYLLFGFLFRHTINVNKNEE